MKTSPIEARDQDPVVETTTGKVVGFRSGPADLCCFFGIPYAEPPIGLRRFRPTVPVKPWGGVRPARNFGHAAPQIFDPTEGDYEEFTGQPAPAQKNPWIGAEDCLTLNVWTPCADNKKRPVIVWVHGGANWLESSRLATYHGDNICAYGDVVFISINYRLGLFGFFDVSVIGGEEYRGSHSHGLHDQLTALRWIKQNAAAFGGDPENITVMGESAGSIDLSWLLANGHLANLARRAVLMSGIAGPLGLDGTIARGFTEECGKDRARDLLSRMEIESINDLQALPTGQIMERLVRVAAAADTLFYMDTMFWPRAGAGGFMPLDPYSAVRAGGVQGIDVMIGYTSYEMGLWLTWDDTLDQHPCRWAAEKLKGLPPPLQKEAAELYSACFSHDDPGARGMHLLGDSVFVMPSIWFADEILRHGQSLWMYQYDRESDPRRRALHAGDQTYLFGKQETPAGRHLLGEAGSEAERQERENLTRALQDPVLSFVRYGDPNRHENKNVPLWPAYTKNDRSVMSFNTTCRIISDPSRERRLWWEKNVYSAFMGVHEK